MTYGSSACDEDAQQTIVVIVMVTKLLKLLRLLRLVRIFRYLTHFEDRMRRARENRGGKGGGSKGEGYSLTSSTKRIPRLIFLILMFAHWDGCLQFLVPATLGFPSRSWVARHEPSLLRSDGVTIFTQYSWALFNAFSHMLCIGYGQSPPEIDAEVWVTIFSMLLGATLYGLFVASLSSLMNSMDSGGSLYNSKLDMVNEYMHQLRLPPELRARMRMYFRHRFANKRVFDESSILGEMSASLRRDITLFTCQDILNKVPLFQGAEPAFISAIAGVLRPALFSPGDVVIQQGDPGHRMYFIKSGGVDILVLDAQEAMTRAAARSNLTLAKEDLASAKFICALGGGGYFGEVSLLQGKRASATVRATGWSQLYQLDKPDFELVMNDFPEVREAMAVVANLRMKRGGGEDSNAAPVVSDTLRAMANLREGDMHRFHERQRQAEETQRELEAKAEAERAAAEREREAAKEAERQERQAVRQEKVKEVQSMVIGRMKDVVDAGSGALQSPPKEVVLRRRRGIDGAGDADGFHRRIAGLGRRRLARRRRRQPRRSPTDRSTDPGRRTESGRRTDGGGRRSPLAAPGSGGSSPSAATARGGRWSTLRSIVRPRAASSADDSSPPRDGTPPGPSPQPSSDRSEAADARRSAGGSPLPDEPPAPITRGASSSVGSTFSGKRDEVSALCTLNGVYAYLPTARRASRGGTAAGSKAPTQSPNVGAVEQNLNHLVDRQNLHRQFDAPSASFCLAAGFG